MKKNTENKWIEYAFGELDASEAEMLRQELAEDAEATKFVSEFEALRQDLKLLDEAPDHQLSTERLRHAILNEGLHKQKKRAGVLSWIWMPGAAAAVTFVLLTVLNRPGEPNIVIPNDAVATIAGNSDNAGKSELDSALAKLDAPASAALSGIAMSQQEQKSNVEEMERSNLRARAKTPRSSTAKIAENAKVVLQGIENAVASKTAAVIDDGAKAPGAAHGASMMKADSAPATPEPIILITPENDAKTGAHRAVEQFTSSNVSISG